MATNKIDKHLENEFARLGFDLKDMSESAIPVGERSILMSMKIDSDITLMTGDNALFLFTVVTPLNDQRCYIELINARLARNTPACYDYEILSDKDYWRFKGSLPTKEQMLTEMAQQLKLHEIREKFGMGKNQTEPRLSQEKVTLKKRV